MSSASSLTLSRYALGIVIPWALITPLQFGQHIAALNQISKVLTCQVLGADPDDCVAMSDAKFSLVTAVMMIGGLVGSLSANVALDKYGRKGCSRIHALLVTLGATTMALAHNMPMLVVGRFFIGAGVGVGLCTTPVYLDELAPPAIRGRIGVLNQLAVVIGILVTQLLGLVSVAHGMWRPVLWFSALLGAAQLLLGRFIVDTPVWLRSVGREGDAANAATRLWSTSKSVTAAPSDDAVERLLDEAEHPEVAPQPGGAQPPVSVLGALRSKDLRKPLIIVAWVMFAQQVSGINAVMYYSNIIMGRALPKAVQYISLGVAVVNAIMTLPAIVLIEKLGRRNLLILSSTGVLVSLLVVAIGIDQDRQVMASVGITVFVGAFAIGLGPVPFIIIPEVAPFHAVSALSSIAISINWIANFWVGLLFLPLKEWLSDNNPYKEGRVFYIFAVIFLVSFVGFLRSYQP